MSLAKNILPTWLLLVCWAGVSAPAAAEEGLLYSLPVYPAAKAAPFQGGLSANNVPLEATLLETDDDVDTVLDFYRQALEKQGRKLVQHKYNPQSGYVGTFDEKTSTMRMATVFAAPNGGAMIVLSSMDPRPLIRPGKIAADLPSLPEATEIVTTGQNASATKQQTVSYQLPDISPAQARKRLRQVGLSLGWQIDVKNQTFGAKALVLQQGNRTCIINVLAGQPEGKGPRHTAVSMIVLQRSQNHAQK